MTNVDTVFCIVFIILISMGWKWNEKKELFFIYPSHSWRLGNLIIGVSMSIIYFFCGNKSDKWPLATSFLNHFYHLMLMWCHQNWKKDFLLYFSLDHGGWRNLIIFGSISTIEVLFSIGGGKSRCFIISCSLYVFVTNYLLRFCNKLFVTIYLFLNM